VLRTAVGANDRIGLSEVEAHQVPDVAVADDALEELPDGARAAVALRPGSVITGSVLVERSSSRTAQVLPPDHVALVVHTGDLPNLAVRGDSVDVIAPGWEDPVAAGATVLAVTGDATTLAVPDADATSTATASLSGPVALVVRPGHVGRR